MPSVESPEYSLWKRIDCMVLSWILNSMMKVIAETFVYADSARALWKDVEDRFGESNAPLIYQIQKEISTTIQGNMSVTHYYSKIKKLWDELNSLEPLPACDCGAVRSISEIIESRKVMQFLMGLNEDFEGAKDQILLMEPLPAVSKVFSSILKTEKQKSSQMTCMENSHMTALLAKPYTSPENYMYNGNAGRTNSKRFDDFTRDKESCIVIIVRSMGILWPHVFGSMDTQTGTRI